MTRTFQSVDFSELAIITVSYHPDLAVLARQMASLPAQALWLIVDNASLPEELVPLRSLVASRENTHLLECTTNIGLAAALNAGTSLASQVNPAIEFLLLMDQDSEPYPDSIKLLLQGFLALEGAGEAVGCVGPRLLDEITGLQHGFHCTDGWRWLRRYPEAGDQPIACANLNGSGTLLRRKLFEALGGLDTGFFIDHVDTDWAFRVNAAGFILYGIPSAVFSHRMGDSSFRFWLFGWKVWPQRSPLRHYYLFRNALLLFRRPYVPVVWKFWACVKLALTLIVHVIADRQRAAQTKSMLRGIWHGISKPG